MFDMTSETPLLGGQTDFGRVAELLGGERVLKTAPKNQFEVHKMLKSGLPQKALDHLVGTIGFVTGGRHFEEAFGMTYRTYQRRKDPGTQPLSPEQSGKTWVFANIFAKAIEIFGSREAAEAWISEPVMGLNRQVPLELLQTPIGVELVNEFLTRLEYGVYT